MYICKYCGSEYPDLNGVDHSQEGFFCEDCDSFTYFNNIQNRHQFRLFLEENGSNERAGLCPIRFSKHLSPLRYPGGKSKMLPLLYQSLNKENICNFVEPFAGGAGVGLALLESNLIQSYILNDIDYGIYALFQTIKTCPEALIEKIKSSSLTHEDFYTARQQVHNGYANCDLPEAAWALLITNRLSFSGIPKAGPLGGKNGAKQQLLSRWNPDDLIKRINKIHNLSDRITVTNREAFEIIEEQYWTPNTTIFIDPPYYQKGKQLYTHYFDEVQHITLAETLRLLSTGCPGADILLSYDNEIFIKDLYYWAPTTNIKLHYSVKEHLA